MIKKDYIEIGITGVLVVIFLLAITSAVHKVRKAKLHKVKVAVAAVIGETPAEEKQLFGRLREESAGISLKRDPFSGAILAPSDTGAALSGILWSQEHPLAIINDVIVVIGDKIGPNTVVDIKQDKVVLSDGTKTLELRLE
ncbi:MAG: hypothetical protein HZB36_03000 [Candidatus Omnitrophica bacterium]|nr:hypothetical protein [Candidatus Omnitrophota bacterium]